MTSLSLFLRVDVFLQIVPPEVYRITLENRFTGKVGIYRTSVRIRSFPVPEAFSCIVLTPEAKTTPPAVMTLGRCCRGSIDSNSRLSLHACQFALVSTTHFLLALLLKVAK